MRLSNAPAGGPRRGAAFALVLLAALASHVSACSTTFRPKACQSDDECGSGLACVSEGGVSACRQTSSTPLRIGMSAPASGPNQDLGTEMKRGISLAFDAQNARGGVGGRLVDLTFRDDEYTPDQAERAARELLDVREASGAPRCPTTSKSAVEGQMPVATTALERGPNGVLALVGNVGTPTMVRTAPLALETGALFFGAFTGANLVLRDGSPGPCSRYIFNVRASYAQEARATLEYFFARSVPDWRHLMSFDQDDSFGQAGYDGLVNAYDALRPGELGDEAQIARFRYTRNDTASVPAQAVAAQAYLASLLASDSAPHVVGVMMTDTYGAAAEFIKEMRIWQHATDEQQTTLKKAERLTITFSNVSFVGPNSLASRLVESGTYVTAAGPKAFAEGVMVSQVVPNYESDTSDLVAEYLRLLGSTPPSFTSLEGYATGLIFLEGLRAHTGAFTPDALVDTFERLPNLSLGLGASSGFSPNNHNYSKSVWGTLITAEGKFANRYYWSGDNSLQLSE